MPGLPFNIEAEKAVLGSLLVDSAITYLALPLLQPNHFYEPLHTEIYKAVQQVAENGQPVDFVTVTNKLQENKKLEAVGGVDYLTELIQSTPSSIHVEHYATIVRNYFKLRSLILTAQRVIRNAHDTSPDSVARTLDSSLDSLYSVFGDVDKPHISGSRQLMEEFWTHFEAKFETGGKIDISTGYAELDAVIEGYTPTDLVVVAGRPSWGKTAFILNSMLRLGKAGVATVLFAYEMSRIQTGQRLVAIHSGEPLQKVRSATGLDQVGMDTVVKSASEIAAYPIYIDSNSFGDVYYLTSAIRRYVQQFGIKVVFVDYLQRLPVMSDDLTAETGKITTILKTLATSLGITIVLVSQLSRRLENENRKPQMSDLRQSGRIEEDADVVLFVYRNLKGESPEDAEIIVDKNRNGPIGSFSLFFEPETLRFIGRDWS